MKESTEGASLFCYTASDQLQAGAQTNPNITRKTIIISKNTADLGNTNTIDSKET